MLGCRIRRRAEALFAPASSINVRHRVKGRAGTLRVLLEHVAHRAGLVRSPRFAPRSVPA